MGQPQISSGAATDPVRDRILTAAQYTRPRSRPEKRSATRRLRNQKDHLRVLQALRKPQMFAVQSAAAFGLNQTIRLY